MTRRVILRATAGWALVTLAAFVVARQCGRIDPGPTPSADQVRWSFAALRAVERGDDVPHFPGRPFRAAGPVVVHAWSKGIPLARHVGTRDLERAVKEAGAAFQRQASEDRGTGPTFYTLTVARGEGPLVLGVPLVENLALVPLHEGLHLLVPERGDAWVTPVDLHAAGVYDRGIRTPIPELKFGLPVPALVGRLARDLGLEREEALSQGRVRRVLFRTYLEEAYPKEATVDARTLRRAAVDGARFLLRHQESSGRYTYVFDARTGRPRNDPYNLPRHAGATYFLAQVGRLAELPEARAGAARGLAFLRTSHTLRCGGRPCIGEGSRVDLGSSALSALAAAEYLAGGEDPVVRTQLEGLTAFLRSMQRPDGELMHEYDLEAQAPIDVQHLYYSGETAFALLRAHAVLGRPEDLRVATAVMAHLTGAAWDFFGSRYYYGEEHWTCIAAGEAAMQGVDVGDALDFCARWAGFNRAVQYGPGDTPWPSSGGYGVGPLLMPRLTPVASRTEAFISTFLMSTADGSTDAALERQIERALGMLLRYRWGPGPTHLLADPPAAHGGMPGSPTELLVRNDFVQHACSAMIRWATVLEERPDPPR